jgi:hypothetical protein
MKQLIILSLFLFAVHQADAKIIRVNNNTGILGVYATLAAAVADAATGDTIHIEGSVTPYTGNVAINKKIVIIGPGYFLSSTAETQYNRETAKIDGNITFGAGSAGSALAGVEHRTGTVANQPYQVNTTSYAGNRVTIQTDSITVVSCKLYYVEIDAAQNRSNLFILRCFFNPGVVATSGTGEVANLTVTNCFFRNDYNTAAPNRAVIHAAAGTQSGWRISRCTFYNSFSAVSKNTAFNDNAFFGASAAASTVTADASNSYTNNVMNFNVASPPYIIDGVNSNTIRTEAIGKWFSQAGASDAVDIYYTAAASTSECPLRDGANPGDNSSSKGMYGGGAPYTPSGMFTIPSVYDIQMDAEVGDNFNMVIRARTH